MQHKVSRRVLARTLAAKLLAEPSRRGYWMQLLAAYVVHNNMAKDVDLILNDIAHELHKQGGHLFVSVTAARKLSDSTREMLTRTLKEATSARRVEVTERTDPDLLGGLIARTPDVVLDVSIRSQLKQLGAIL